MSSNNTTKKRKVDSDESGISLAAVLAEMQEMKSKLSRMDELESRCINMQNEMDGVKSRSTIMQNEINSMKDRISHIDELENKCDSLQRSVEILSKESSWEYSAQSIPNSHWTDLGFDAEYIQDMTCLVNEIRNKTCRMRNGECIQYITLGEESPEDAAGTLLQYDDVLLPHWKEFITALQLLHHGIDLNLTMQNVQLTSSVISMLTPAMRGKLKTLFLDNNGFVSDQKGIEFLVTCMQSNRKLNDFYLSSNQLGGIENARSVLDAVRSHPSIDKVRFENCLGGDINGYDMLCFLLASVKALNI